MWHPRRRGVRWRASLFQQAVPGTLRTVQFGAPRWQRFSLCSRCEGLLGHRLRHVPVCAIAATESSVISTISALISLIASTNSVAIRPISAWYSAHASSVALIAAFSISTRSAVAAVRMSVISCWRSAYRVLYIRPPKRPTDRPCRDRGSPSLRHTPDVLPSVHLTTLC